LLEQAALRINVVPVIWGPDHRWNTLLRQTFQSHASAVIGSPLVILGLSKLAHTNGTPLYVRNVMSAGSPCLDWMKEGIVQGLDCNLFIGDESMNEDTLVYCSDPDLDDLRQELHSWTSILDCRLEKGQYGLEMEIVSFPGRQLPKLPSCAKLVVRPLNPEKDVPFGLLRDWENLSFSQENH
ncbi:MAG: hypothetical protein UHS47_01515, partial [Oscillospiraceae bacterium]|nr:hypothetical protein [Oscillospiraceae bacterium]